MKINNFKHDSDNETITFEVKCDGKINIVEVEWVGYCTNFTDIDKFTENWTDHEYEALDAFISGCSDILHQFHK